MQKNIFYGSCLLLSVMGFSSCIDEDLSDCPPATKDAEILYKLEVAQDVALGFSDEVHSLHLGFWNSPSSLYRDDVIPQESLPADMIFRVTIPVDNYSHIAVANGESSTVGAYSPFPSNLSEALVSQPTSTADVISATGVPAYVGTLQMNMEKGFETDHYEVLLTAASSKYVLHVNRPETLKNMKCYIQGTKQSYAAWDKVWAYNEKVRTNASAYGTHGETTSDFEFYAFPTQVSVQRATPLEPGWWKLYLYSELGDKIVEHIFTIKEPVEPGQVFEATFNVTEQGGEAVDVDAGVEFNPDWQPGGDHDENI